MSATVHFVGGNLSNPATIMNAVSAFRVGASRTDSSTRQPGRGQVLDLASYRERMNAQRIDQALQAQMLAENRSDSFSQNAGFELARDLEFIHSEVLEEKFAVPTAMELFAVDTSVSPGATTQTIRRLYSFGEAKVYNGRGSDIPRVGANQREESFPIRHIVSSYGWNVFEAQSSNFSGSGLLTKLARIARDAIMELANRIYWGITGDQYGLYGVLTYPWLPKKDIATGFSRATVTASPDTVLGELHDLVNFPHQVSKSLFQPDTLVMTNRVSDVLTSVRMSSGSDTTIMENFLKNSAHIKTVEIAHELEDAGGTGIDGILAYRKDSRGIQLSMPQGITQLPVQDAGFESTIISFMSIGGVIMEDVLNNILGFADTTS